MKKLFRDGVEAYGDLQEAKDELIVNQVSRGVNAIVCRYSLSRIVLALCGLNVFMWTSTLIVPGKVFFTFRIIFGVSDKIGMAALAVVVAIGTWITYSLLQFRFPTIEDALENDVLGSFNYTANSNKSWLVWITSIVGGVLNLLGLAIMTLYLNGY